MRVIDPGHIYALPNLDGPGEQIRTYVKREGPGYPGNIGNHPGSNLQEGWRADIDRLKYLNSQVPDPVNELAIENLRLAILLLEHRAAKRHGRIWEVVKGEIELIPTCPKCGHIQCAQTHVEETDAR